MILTFKNFYKVDFKLVHILRVMFGHKIFKKNILFNKVGYRNRYRNDIQTLDMIERELSELVKSHRCMFSYVIDY